MAYKRLWEAKSTFKKCSAKLSPQKRKKYEGIYTEKGVFEFKPQTTQVCFCSRVDIPFVDLDTVSRTILAVWKFAPSGESVRVG